jgi:hypothetical protein
MVEQTGFASSLTFLHSYSPVVLTRYSVRANPVYSSFEGGLAADGDLARWLNWLISRDLWLNRFEGASSKFGGMR